MEYRQRIIGEAAALFMTYGIRAVTMDMIAGRMGISKRTIYEVFKDKDELLRGVLKDMSERQYDLLIKTLDESNNVIEAVFKMLDLMRHHFSTMSPAFQLDIKKYHFNIFSKMKEKDLLPYNRNNQEIIMRGIKEGVFREDLDLEVISKCMLEVVKQSNSNELFPPEIYHDKDIPRTVYLNYLRGISTQKGLDLINFYENQHKQ